MQSADCVPCRLRTMQTAYHADCVPCRLRTMQSADCILSPMQSADCAGSQIACNMDINTTSCCGHQHNFLLWTSTQLLVVDICTLRIAVMYEPLYMQVNTSNSEIGVEILGVGL